MSTSPDTFATTAKENYENTAAGAAGDSSSPPARKKLKLVDLPAEMLGTIAEHAGDFESILNLARSDPKISDILRNWKCSKCNDGIFVMSCVEGNDDEEFLDIPAGATPFVCNVCGNKFCGRTSRTWGAKYHFCTISQKCSGCGKLECHKCMCAHLEDCGACGRFNTSYCSDCQGKCDEFCDLCGFSFCQHHGDHCDKCGIKTCGVHDFSCDKCSYCQKSYCPRCHGHGDCMWHCGGCHKRSCNANGDGNSDCPQFEFDYYDWPVCRDCHGSSSEEDFDEEEGDY